VVAVGPPFRAPGTCRALDAQRGRPRALPPAPLAARRAREPGVPLLRAAALTGEQSIIDGDRLVRDRGFDASAAGPAGARGHDIPSDLCCSVSEERDRDGMSRLAEAATQIAAAQ
jgi:hypothetical protein